MSKPEKSSDLAASLGFMSIKILPPDECDINHFAIEQFFNNIRRPELSNFNTADHLEHGFAQLASAAQTPQLSELQLFIDYFFIFTFSNIMVNDGEKRASEFVSRQSYLTQFDSDFISSLSRITSDKFDSFTEITDYLLHPVSYDLSIQFYENLNQWLKSNPIPGASYLLRTYLHNTTPTASPMTLSDIRMNRRIDHWGFSDKISLPCEDPKIAVVVDRPTFFPDLNLSKVIPVIEIKPQPTKTVHVPSISIVRAPARSDCATFTNNLLIYSIGPILYYCNFKEGKPEKLTQHLSSITTLKETPDGNAVLIADSLGIIKLHGISQKTLKKEIEYRILRRIITCFAIMPYGQSFFAGTSDGSIFYFLFDSPEPIRVIKLDSSPITAMDIHQNCEYLAVASSEGKIRLVSITQGNCVRIWKVKGIPFSIHISHNGKSIIVTTETGHISILDCAHSSVEREFSIGSRTIDSVFSPDDQFIAITDSTGGFSYWNRFDEKASALTVLKIEGIHPSNLTFFDSDQIRIFGFGDQQIQITADYL